MRSLPLHLSSSRDTVRDSLRNYLFAAGVPSLGEGRKAVDRRSHPIPTVSLGTVLQLYIGVLRRHQSVGRRPKPALPRTYGRGRFLLNRAF